MIELNGISKTFKVAQRKTGTGAAFKSLFKRDYKYVEAVKNISFSIQKGEIVGYIGPNGAGKSTTIKMMSGILVPDSGECKVMGYTPWKDRREYVKKIGVVFGQKSQLWWDVPISDSFELLRDIYKIPREKYTESLDMLVETLGLSEFINTPLRQVSLGQRMRAELCASLLHEPEILFLDEPTIGLDAVSKLSVRNFIKTVNRTKKTTVILTTHDMDDIEALTDRIVFIGKGRILYDGSMTKIREQFTYSKKLTVTFIPHSEPVEIEDAKLVSWSESRAVYEAQTNKTTVSSVLAGLEARLNITDITVENPPVEEIIAQLYREYEI